MPQLKKVVFIIAAVSAAVVALIALNPLDNREATDWGVNPNHATAELGGSLTIVTLSQDKLAAGASYKIAVAAGGAGGNHTVRDGEVGVDASPVDGILSLQGMPDGTFSVVQLEGPAGQEREIIPKIVVISNSSSEIVTFGASQAGGVGQSQKNNGLDQIESVLYSAKFECGTIRGDEGPLRPGHYNTDIGLYNKQRFPVQFTWSAAANNKVQQNAILKTLNSQSSSSIVCNDIQKLTGIDGNFTEGYVLIEVPLDPKLKGSISGGTTVLDSTGADKIDLLEVQTFYSANALDELPHPVMVDKITFILRSNATVNGLPDSMIGTLLDVTVPSQLSEISDLQERIRDHIMQKYKLSEIEVAKLTIEIKSVDIGVGTMIDDHAISLSKISPQPKTG